jgi:hypothetical protein
MEIEVNDAKIRSIDTYDKTTIFIILIKEIKIE